MSFRFFDQFISSVNWSEVGSAAFGSILNLDHVNGGGSTYVTQIEVSYDDTETATNICQIIEDPAGAAIVRWQSSILTSRTVNFHHPIRIGAGLTVRLVIPVSITQKHGTIMGFEK